MPPPVAATSTQPQLEARAVHLWRGEKHLLRGVSFALYSGELLQVVGPNGVGKTSLLRSIAGLLPVEAGEIFWRGLPLPEGGEEFHRELAYLAHNNGLKADLTALENLYYGLSIRRAVTTAELRDTLRLLQIEACADLPVRALSAGQKRRVALARVMSTRAPLWILDEPITNLDKAGIALFEARIAEHMRAGGMILTAAHQLLLQGQPGVRTLELQ